MSGDLPIKQSTTIPNSDFFQTINSPDTGWKCPKCDKVYSPNTSECYECNANNNTKWATTDDQSYQVH